MALRLDRFLAEAGVGSRSEVKKYIRAKQISVNGLLVVRPEAKINEQKDVVTYCGKRIFFTKYVYYLLHKPAGCVTATEDAIHKTVMDCMADVARPDLFPVGRLDRDTEGLLIITNDGELAHALLSPKKHVPKTYYAKIRGRVTEKEVLLFEAGIDIGEDTRTRPAKLKILKGGEISEIELTITEGKFHQVKRMFLAVGMQVLYLKRIAMGSLRLPDDLPPGAYRTLTKEELEGLRENRGQQREGQSQ